MNQASLETSQYHILKPDKNEDGKNEPRSIRNPAIEAKKLMEENSPQLSRDNLGIKKRRRRRKLLLWKQGGLRNTLCSTVSLKGKVNRKCTQR